MVQGEEEEDEEVDDSKFLNLNEDDGELLHIDY